MFLSQITYQIFLCGGQVTECRLVVDPRTRESRGFGFVTMDNGDDAERCVKYLNRSTLEGRIITVEKVSFIFLRALSEHQPQPVRLYEPGRCLLSSPMTLSEMRESKWKPWGSHSTISPTVQQQYTTES